MTTTHNYTDEDVVNLRLCMDNPIYFIENYVKIPHPAQGVGDMSLYDHQNIIIDAYQENRLVTQKMARQMGTDTTLAAYALWWAMFKNDQMVVVTTRGREDSHRFNDLVRTMYHHLPEWLKPKLTRNNKTETCFESGSRILCRIGNTNACRGMAISLLIMLDFDRYRDAEDMLHGVMPVISAGGTNKCIITGSGHHPCYFNNVHASDEFHHVEFAWYHHPKRDESWAIGMKSQMGSDAFRDEYNLGAD